MKKKVDVYLHSSKESMYDVGQRIGLSEEAMDKFKYAAYEVKLTMSVDTKTGESAITHVDGRKVAK